MKSAVCVLFLSIAASLVAGPTEDALASLQTLTGAAKAKGQAVTYKDISGILVFGKPSGAVDMWTSASIARTEFSLPDGSTIKARLNELRKTPTSEWSVIDLTRVVGETETVLYQSHP